MPYPQVRDVHRDGVGRKHWPESKGEFETEVRLIAYEAKP
jgi:hypothetical protein